MRDAALEAVRARIARAAQTQDADVLLAEQSLLEAATVAAATDLQQDLEAARVLGSLRWNRYLALPAGANEDDFAAAVELFTPVFQADPAAVPGQLRDACQRAVVGLRADDGGPEAWDEQASAAVATYERTGDAGSLLKAMTLFRASLQATLPGDSQYPRRLSDLGAALLRLFERTGQEPVLAEAIQIGRQAVAVTPQEHSHRPVVLSNLALELGILYEQTGQETALDEAVQVSRDAVAATPDDHPHRTGSLTNLGLALLTLYERTGQEPVLAEAIQIGRQAVAVTPQDHPYRPAVLSNLGYDLRLLYELTGQQAVLDEAVQVSRDAVAATPDDHPRRVVSITNLGLALQTLYERTGRQPVLEEAVRVGRDAVAAAPDGSVERAGVLSNLGLVLRLLFDRTGRLAALEEAVRLEREAVAATPDGHPDRAVYLSNLGIALQSLFEWTGRQGLLEEAVQLGRDAVAATPDDHPLHAMYLSNLGLVLRLLFEWTGQQTALQEAVRAGRDAVAATPDDSVERPRRLSNLAIALRDLSERTGQQAAVEEAAQVGRQAVATTPDDHPEYAMYLSNLGMTLRDLSERTGQQAAIEEAAQVGRQAVAATPDDHPSRPGRLSNLGFTLRLLFERTGRLPALEDAIQVGRQAVEEAPDDHPNRVIYLSNLASALEEQFKRTGSKTAGREAMAYFRQAAALDTAPAGARIRASRAHAALAESMEDSAGEVLAAVEAAVGLLPQAVPRHLIRGDRQYELGQLAGIAAQAAAAAVNAGRPDRAVELLEATRGILVAHTLDARGSDLAELRSRAPDLAARFGDLRDRIEVLDRQIFDGREPTQEDTPGQAAQARTARQAAEALTAARRQAHAEWDALLGLIRALDSFADFLQPPRVRQIAAQVTGGPIVFVYAHSAQCGALIVTGNLDRPVRPVALADLAEDDARELTARLRQATIIAGDLNARPSQRAAAQTEIHDVLAWIWDTITEPVLTALNHTAPPGEGEDWPRVWWCPVGVLAQLPLHAAGHHPRTEAEHAAGDHLSTVLDRIVSSYTATARTLAYARAGDITHPSPGTVIIAEPGDSTTQHLPGTPLAAASGIPPLPGAAAEARDLAALIPGAHVLTHPTHDEVLDALPHHAVAHFACHGQTDWNDPSASRLILRDHHAQPLTVTEIAALRLGHAGLAYLSACDTTVTSAALADEAVHITAAFQLAGYQHVIGTLWPITDDAARPIARDVYTHLTNHSTTTPGTASSAHALHHAVRRMRAARPAVPTLWAAHLHTGT
jgi:tetratricopeptide (TPR) repeat protein